MYLAEAYTFTPGLAGQGTIEIPGSFQLEDFGVITNVTRNSILYDPAEGDAGATLTSGPGSVTLTLEQTTSYCAAEDSLQIIILKAPEGGATEATLESIDNKLPALVGGKIPVDIGTNIDVTIDNTSIEVSNDAGNPVPVSGTVNTLSGLDIPPHNYISLSYTGSNLTGVVYKSGGSGGTVVATLSLGYDGNNNLTSVTKL